MADEQTPQSDLIDDAIRQAERQLEAKLEALRMSALGATTPSEPAPDSDVAILRPTGGEQPAPEQPRPATAWEEGAGEDLMFMPATPTPAAATPTQPVPAATEPGTPAELRHASVTDLMPVWDDEFEPSVPAAQEPEAAPAPIEEPAQPTYRDEPEWDRPEPVHASWTGHATDARPVDRPEPAAEPNEDERAFWAQTRAALHAIQTATETAPRQITSELRSAVRDAARDAIEPTERATRSLGENLPKLADRIEDVIAPSLDAIGTLRDGLRADLDSSTAAIRRAVQADVAQLEETIASNVTRMAQGTADSVSRVERDLDTLGEAVARFELGVGSEFQRLETELRSSIEQAGRAMGDDLPSRLDEVERTLLAQVRETRSELGSDLSALVEANRAAMDRFVAVASTLDDDRSRRAEDLAVVVDTVTTGWEGLAAAVKALYAQNEQTGERIGRIEQRLTQIRDLEGAVEETMTELRTHIRDLKPAPVVVTVSHAEAEVQNTTRSGWAPDA